MASVYVIIENGPFFSPENGEAYPAAFTTFAAAKAVLLEKHKEILEQERAMAEEEELQLEDDIPSAKENEDGSGKTILWIESIKLKVTIFKLPIIQ
jgi:hypothetical protein